MKDNHIRVNIKQEDSDKLKSLKLAYKKDTGKQITNITIMSKLIQNAKLKDIK